MQPKFRHFVWILSATVFGYGIATAQFAALDPVRVAPHIFENLLENDYVRVLKVTERNGETAPLHARLPKSLRLDG